MINDAEDYPARKLIVLERVADAERHVTLWGAAHEAGAQKSSKVAVITRTKDRPLLLPRAAASVGGQTIEDLHWVVVNDGGDEQRVLDIVSNGSVDPARISLVSSSKSIGMEAASNLGIAHCRSQYIVIHDDDDGWEPTFLEKTTHLLDSAAGQRYGGVVTHSVYVEERIEDNRVVEITRGPYIFKLESVQLAELACGNRFPPIAFVFRRSAYDKVGGFDEQLPVLGDWKFNLAVLMQTDIAVIREPLALYHHRIHAGDIYANTVVGSTAMHKEFNAVVRNQLIRGGGTLGMAMALGHMAQDQRDRLDTLTNRVKSLEKTVAMQSLALERLTGLDRTAEPNDSNARDKAWIIRHLRSRRKLPERLKIAWGFRRLGRSIPWPDLSAALAQYGFSIPIPPDFDEACYLAENADVANDVRQGKFGSGYDHYVKYGLVEGRRRPNH